MKTFLAVLLGTGILAGGGQAQSEVNAAPVITLQPRSQDVHEGSSISLSVTATGTAPLAYQWLKDGTNLSGAKGTNLPFASAVVADSGAYTVVVTNLFGVATSDPAELRVRPVTSRKLRVAGYELPSASRVRLPLELAAQGDENVVAFTVTWNPTVLAYTSAASTVNLQDPDQVVAPTPDAGLRPADLVTDLSRLAEGRLGLTLSLPANWVFKAATNRIAELEFDLLPGRRPAQAALGFLEEPVYPAALTTNLTALPLEGEILARLEPGAPPVLDLQSGHFLQTVTLINPARSNLPSARIVIHGLGKDTLTNAIRVENAVGSSSGDPFVQFGPMAGSAQATLTVRYYVSDRLTVPTPVFESQAAEAVVPEVSEIRSFRLDTPIYRDRTMIIEFSSITNAVYYVQYQTYAGSTNWSTVIPGLVGNGYRMQWVDRGPPETPAPPTSERARFYRLIQYP